MLTESTFKGPADILVPIARILSQWFHVYFCPYSSLPAWIFPINLVDTTRQHCEAAACHWMQPSLLSACQALALLTDFPLSREGHGQVCKFTSIAPPHPGEQTRTSFSSSATQFDRCIGHFSFRKPRDMALGFKPWCPCAQSGCPWAAVPENSTHAVPRGACRGYQVLCHCHSAPPELRQGDCFLTHSCTHKLRTQFCPLTQTPISQSIQRGRLHR